MVETCSQDAGCNPSSKAETEDIRKKHLDIPSQEANSCPGLSGYVGLPGTTCLQDLHFSHHPPLCFLTAYSEPYIIDAIYNLLHSSPLIENDKIYICFLSK